MKIGRNDPCYCGSGKKYKKCCIDKRVIPEVKYDKNYFNFKGKKAENFVQELAQKSFLTDWCYPNPKLPDGRELCDLLVVFDDKVIIWQIKDLKVSKDGQYHEGDVKKNLSQLSGAKRSLFDLKREIELENPRRGKERFDPNKIKEIYLISALVGEEQNFMSFFEKYKGKKIHVFNREAVEIMMNELDTIEDFVGYIKQKEDLLNSNREVWINGGEKELLAYYLIHQRSFEKLKENNGVIVMEEGFWEGLSNRPEYKAKKEEDRISYFWDVIIDKAHTSKDAYYEKIAKEMAKRNRFQRRILSKTFLDAHTKAHGLRPEKDYFHRIIIQDGITYCFVYRDGPHGEERAQKLALICLAARSLYKENEKVIGISTSMEISEGFACEFCLVEKKDWTDEDEKNAKTIIDTLGIFKNFERTYSNESEYPSQ